MNAPKSVVSERDGYNDATPGRAPFATVGSQAPARAPYARRTLA